MRDPHDIAERLAAFRHDPAAEEWLTALNQLLADAELPAPPSAIDPAQLPLIYIVGAPRSGTTLLSQLLSRYLAVGYINNLIARFWLRPSVGIRLSDLVLGAHARERIELESRHGSTEGAAGPHEFGYFWRHWLQLDSQPTHHLSDAAAQRVDRAGLRHALRDEILDRFGLPVVFKNVICGFHAPLLSEVHPQSWFVHITRDRRDTAASILKSRHQRYGSYDAWWSLKPSTFSAIAGIADPCEQVVRQIDDCRAEIAESLRQAGVRSKVIRYEALCADVRGTLTDLAGSIEPPVQLLDGVPDRLPVSAGTTLPAPLEESLRLVLERGSPHELE